jgi:hypothetical protein
VQVMETSKRVLGPEHPDTLTSMGNLAFTWKGQGRDKEAIVLMKQCVWLRERVLGPDHPFTLSSRKALIRWSRSLRAKTTKESVKGKPILQPTVKGTCVSTKLLTLGRCQPNFGG